MVTIIYNTFTKFEMFASVLEAYRSPLDLQGRPQYSTARLSMNDVHRYGVI
jgi:hypothetical protein